MPVKPSDNEERFIQEQELKRRMQQALADQHTVAAEEKRRLKELHWMHCPKCGHKLHVESYGKIEVDVCAGCKGVWLDANELEAIIEGSNAGIFRSFLRALGK
jgi:uncharacterized protein